MFRAINGHLQEDTVVYMQHMVLSLCKQVSGRGLLHDHSPVYKVTLPYAACVQCILLKMNIYGSKHVEE